MGKGISIASFILSILIFIPLAPAIGFILGIVSLVKNKDEKSSLKGLAIAAIILGAIFGLFQLISLPGLIFGFVKSISSS